MAIARIRAILSIYRLMNQGLKLQLKVKIYFHASLFSLMENLTQIRVRLVQSTNSCQPEQRRSGQPEMDSHLDLL